jgi:hypothetical protein
MQYLYISVFNLFVCGGYLMASECGCSCTKLSLVQIMFTNQDIRRDVEADCSESVAKSLKCVLGYLLLRTISCYFQ